MFSNVKVHQPGVVNNTVVFSNSVHMMKVKGGFPISRSDIQEGKAKWMKQISHPSPKKRIS